MKKLIFFAVFLIISFQAQAQSVIDDIGVEEKDEQVTQAPSTDELPTETIQRISESKRIFIITNTNQSFAKGDFVSLLRKGKLICRALVAKNSESNIAGIKILKIYSLSRWSDLAPGGEVQVLRGDDSYYKEKEKQAQKPKDELKSDAQISNEDDLFNSTSIKDEEDLSEENANRLIRTDNIVTFNVGWIEGRDENGDVVRYTHPNASWSFQLTDNVWSDLSFGQTTVRDYPISGGDSQMNNFIIKFKYTFNAPMYSYLQPYAGYQYISASSPVSDLTAAQQEMVDDLAKSSIVFGVSFLKRLVPGWFARLDLGTDMYNLGVGLEF